ncbi:MAG: esterase [Acidobacteria bacterium]|jgi:1,4-dihydroxy-2-naphthoyl-CoA hydrolase|nr:esterase [Acidobacteriota bacterium]
MNKNELLERTEQNELLQFLGVKIESAEKEKVVLTMEVTPKVHQYVGIMNGGVSLFLCETAASIGAVINTDLTKYTPVGIEINANHLRAVSRGIISVEAKPLYSGRTVSVWNIEIYSDRRKLICSSRCSVLLRKGGAFPDET